MKRFAKLLLLGLCACGPQSTVASPTPVFPPDAGVDPNAPDAAPDTAGELPMTVVDEHMEPVREKVKACAAATTFEGKVVVRATIYPDGRASAEVEDAAGAPAEILDCVTGAFAEATFPTSQRGQRFKYSFSF
jgi:hypothetical protein